VRYRRRVFRSVLATAVVLPLAACMLPPPNGALAPSPTVEVKDDQFSSAVPLSAARVSDASHYYEQSQPGKADLAHIGQHASTMYCNCGLVVCAIGANFWFCSSRDRSAPLTCA